MIKNMSEIPEFNIGEGGVDQIYNADGFHKRIMELVADYIDGVSSETKLCYLITEDGETLSADLPPNSFKQSLQRSMEHFVETENYEMCEEVKKLIERI